MKTLVMKFGGAAVSTPQQFSHIADLIIARQQEFSRIIVVVSAMGETTDQLIDLAKQVNPYPPQREYDMLISVGERISMTLLAMALCSKGVEAISFTGSQSGILTCGNHSQAQIIDVKPYRLESSLQQGKIVIVAGFQGVSLEKEITTLGRGGSDTSAVALGIALGAEKVEFYKDVAGVFPKDPKSNPQAECFFFLPYQDALEIVHKGAQILHARAIQLALKNRIPLHVRSFLPDYLDHPGTLIYEPGSEKRSSPVFETEEYGKEIKEPENNPLQAVPEPRIHPVFMHRNEEEVMRNILDLTNQIKYIGDLPQISIHFDEQEDAHLYFTIILARPLKSESPSITEILKRLDSNLEYLHDRTKIMGYVRKKYPKEATVFRLKLLKKGFLRADKSINVYKARLWIVNELKRILGEFRDFNGGMIAKQYESLLEIRKILHNLEYDEILLENFFYSLAPDVSRALIDPEAFKTLFLILLEGIKEFKKTKSYLKFHSDSNILFVLMISEEPSFKEKINQALKALHLPEIAFAHVNIEGFLCLGYIFSINDQKKQEMIYQAISQALEAKNHIACV